MYGKIERKELYQFLDTPEFKETAQTYFGEHQPHIRSTGWYSVPSWNWSYKIGITSINGTGSDHDGNGIQSGTVQYFEVVTQFGEVVAARKINLPAYN